jgi:hypothetical protein
MDAVHVIDGVMMSIVCVLGLSNSLRVRMVSKEKMNNLHHRGGSP